MIEVNIGINILPSSLGIKDPSIVTLGVGGGSWAPSMGRWRGVVAISVYSGETPTGMAVIASFWMASASCEGRAAQ